MIKGQVKKKIEKHEGSAFRDTSDRFAVDQLLRDHGYHVHRRRGRTEPVWLREGVEYRQSEALLRIAKFQVSDALRKDQEYWGSDG